jgi:hypothetical protein
MNTYYDLFDYLKTIQNEIELKKFLKTNDWRGKDKQESIFRLFSFLKLFPEFSSFDVCKGNFNKKTFKTENSLQILLNQKLKDVGDKSDLTFMNDKKQLIITTSKNLNKYSIQDLDIRSINSLFQDKYKNFGFTLIYCIVIRNKNVLFDIVQSAHDCNDDIKQVIYNETTIILDQNDLVDTFELFKSVYGNVNIIDIVKLDKVPLILKLHQKLSVYETTELIKKNVKNILWGHLPRSGKSYIMAGLIDHQKSNNIIIITTAPTETIQQYLNVFQYYIQFDDYTTIFLNGKNKKPKLGSKNIIICSKQFLQKKDIKWLKKIKFDLRFIDESHNGGTTEITKDILMKYGENATTIYLTATYMKPVNSYNIPPEHHILWDLEDIKLCQNVDNVDLRDRLIQKHKNIKLFINSLCDIKKEYNKYPNLNIMNIQFQDELEKDILELTENNEEGFSLDSIFMLKNNSEEILSEFVNDENVLKLSKMCFIDILGQIKTICEKNNSRTFTKEKPLSILCFLPCGNTFYPIDKLSYTFKTLLEKHKIVTNFNISSINSKDNGGDDVSKLIENEMNKVKLEGKKGLIILSGKQASLGITIKHCDIVFLLNNITSFDTIFQMMFRCMTEDENKNYGFVVDINIQRTANLLTEYSQKIYSNESFKTAMRKVLEQHIITLIGNKWLEDCFNVDKIDVDKVVSRVYEKYKQDSAHAIDHILSRLKFSKNLLSEEEQKMVNEIFLINKQKKKKKEKVDEMEGKDKDVKKGIVEKHVDKTESENTEKKEEDIEEVNFIRDVIRHVIPLLCLLTIRDDKINTFDGMCNIIKTNDKLKEIFMQQLHIWWGDKIKENVFESFDKIYNSKLKANTEIKQVVEEIKEVFTFSMNNQKQLSVNIDKYLIPQELEKKQNAEISTPYKLRQEMLNSIDTYVPDFWKQKRKVFEPCCGKGGFLIDIIDRFIKCGIDYKTIVEECLYFSDINPTNIFICKLLLDPYDKYKLNWNEGDTLKLDIKKKWNIDGFDTVIGNPPYNAKQESKGKRGGGDLLWNKFTIKSIDYYLNVKGYLLFVHPSGWRKPESEKAKYNNIFKKLTSENQMLYLEIHNTKDGMVMFRCGTRYDWYLVEKNKKYKNTLIKDENGNKTEQDLEKWKWLPNCKFDRIFKLLGESENECCNVLYSRNDYGTDKKWVSKIKNNEFKYTLIHSTPKSGVRHMYTNDNTRGHFGIPKVIFGDSGINEHAIIDKEGKYGMTQHSIGILGKTDELVEILNTINKNVFEESLKACMWSNFQIDWRLFKYFKKDFWKNFI